MLFDDCEDRSANVGAVLVRRVRLGAVGVVDLEGCASSGGVEGCSVGLVEGVMLVDSRVGATSVLEEFVRDVDDFCGVRGVAPS